MIGTVCAVRTIQTLPSIKLGSFSVHGAKDHWHGTIPTDGDGWINHLLCGINDIPTYLQPLYSSEKYFAIEHRMEERSPAAAGGASAATLAPSAAQRARAERNRLRARALRAARPALAPASGAAADTGGGFLPEEETAAPRAARPPAPVVDPDERPHCLECGRPFAHSHLYDTFEYAACDECRDERGAHALVTRTEAKAEYLLTDADLDARAPPLRCVRRRNPHAARGDMRLYLRAQLEERALEAWGSAARLRSERSARAERRAAGCARRGARALRALRMDVRSSLFAGTRAPHEHSWGEESYDAAEDLYSRACACGQVETYEKM